MHSRDDLLYLLNSDGADELRLHVGVPPVLVLQGEDHLVAGPPTTAEECEELLRSLATTRQRRELRERGQVLFVYRHRGAMDFVVQARMQDGQVGIHIH